MQRLEAGKAKRMLVIAPLSILEPSWGDDIRKFFPTLRFGIAVAPAATRFKAFKGGAEVVIINTDGVKWLADHLDLLYDGFTDLCVDEFTSFKHRSRQRSRALRSIATLFSHKTLLSGTPTPNLLTDLWHPMIVLDGGERLGSSFYRYQTEVCQSRQVGPSPRMIKWEDKPGADTVVMGALKDITIRHKFEDCVDIPAHSQRTIEVTMPPSVMRAYEAMQNDSWLELQGGKVTAVNAAVRAGKLLQILSGSVYSREGKAVLVHNDRYELVMQLVTERDHSVVGFTWQHEKEALLAQAKKHKMEVAVIDGKATAKQRRVAVQDFQAGKLRALLCHPASAAHGLTLTKGRATIWCSATYNSEFFMQMNRRIYRAGQDKPTETIMIAAKDSMEEQVYRTLDSKIDRTHSLLELLTRRQ